MANTKITTRVIADDAITSAQIADNAINSEHYVDGSIDTAHIANGQVTVDKMAANSIDSAQYVDGSIDTAHYADNSITGAELADNIDIAGTLDVTGATTLDSTLSVAGVLTGASLDISGNIDIDGTSNLDVVDIDGAVDMASTLAVAGVLTSASSVINTYLTLKTTDDQANNWVVYTHTNDSLEFNYNGSGNAEVVIANTGKVGIGLTNPTAKLTINNSISTAYSASGYAATPANSMLYLNNTQGGSNTASLINFRTGSGDGVIGFVEGGGTNDADFIIQTDGGSNGVERLRVLNNGNVGIGEDGPADTLHVNKAGGVARIRIGSGNDAYYTQKGYLGDTWAFGSGETGDLVTSAITGGNFSNSTAGGAFVWKTTNSGAFNEKMRITSNGNVGIGTNEPGHILHVLKPGSGDAALMLETASGGDPTLIFNSAAANRNGVIKFQDNGTNAGRIDYVHNGDRLDIQAGSASGATMSIKNGRVGIGTINPSANLDIAGGGSSTVPTLELTSDTSTAFNHSINAFNANLTEGEGNLIVVGRAGSTKNAGWLGYKYSSAGSDSNIISLGHWGNNWLLNVKGNGKVGIGTETPLSDLHVKGNIGHMATGSVSVSSGVSDSGMNIITGVHGSYVRGSGRLRVMGTENNQNGGYAEYMYSYAKSGSGTYNINLKFINEAFVGNSYSRPRLYLYNSSSYNNTSSNRQNTNQTAGAANTNIGQIGITNVANQYGGFQIVAEPMHWIP